MIHRLQIIIILILLGIGNTHAQYIVERYTTDNGLPQNSIKKIHLDNLGFLWLATEDGLVRYNGQSFSIYNKSNLPYITQNRFTALHYTNDPKIIYAINVEGVAFKIQDGKIANSDKKNSEDLHLPLLNEIHARYWAKAYGQAYKSIQTAIPTGYLESRSFPYSDSSFSIYGDGFVRLYSKTKLLKILKVPGGIVPLKFITLNKKHFFITKNAKIFAVNYDENKICKVEVTGAYSQLIETLDTKSFDVFKNWYTKNAYLQNKDLLYRLSMNAANNKLSLDYIANNVPLNNEKTFDISADESTIFFGTTTEGLFILKKNSFDDLIPQGPLLNEYSFYGLIPYSKNSVLTSNGYLLNDDKSHKRIFTSNDDNRYITKFNNIIYFTKNHKICKLINGFTTEITLPNWLTRPGAFLNDQHNEFIWIAYEKGIAKINKNDIIENVFTSNLIDTTANSPIYCLLQDTLRNNLYIGTSNSIIKFNYKNNTNERLKALLGKRVRTLNLINNILFVGTEGDGYYTLLNDTVYKMPLDDNNNLSSVHCFVKDKSNRIWMPSNKGLFMVTLESIINYINNKNKTIYYYYFDKRNGITNIEFNGGCQPCAAILANETILLPSIQGVISFNPTKINIATFNTNILFDKVIADSIYTSIDNLVLKGKLSQYQFYWSSAVWNSGQKNNFEFNILGLDTNWKKIEVESPIVLSNLSKGNYTLQIRKKMPEGNYLTKQLTFKILPQWYETIAFYITIILLSIGLFIFSLKTYANSIMHKNIKLEEAIAKRTGELKIANDKLVKEIDLKNKIVGIISHDMITPLSYMNIVTSELIATKPAVSKENLEKNIEILNQSASGILLTANNTLNLLNINKNNIQINIRRLDLRELVQEKLNIYSIVAQKKEIELNNGIEKKLFIHSDITLLGLVIQNIINNSVKYTMKGAVNIYCQTTEGITKLFIEDSGLGMSSQMLETIKMQSEILSSNEDIYTNNQKMGWNIIVDILRLLNVHYEIESKENEGTVVTLQLK